MRRDGLVFSLPAILAQRPQSCTDLLVRGDDGATVAHRTEILGGIEAETPDGAEAARPAPAALRAMSLRAILDDWNAVALPDRDDVVDGGHLAIEVGDDDGLCPVTETASQRLRVHCQAAIINVGKHRGRTDPDRGC